jgi:hypothetical protein
MKKEFIVERNGRSFVLYAGLLDLAHERGLKAISTTLVQVPSDMNGQMAIVHATVELTQGTFTGLGDAAPDSVSRMMLPHLIRMAETRAKARALRDAVNVGVTSLEELGDLDESGEMEADQAPRGRAATAPFGRGLRALEAEDVTGVLGSEDGNESSFEPVATSRGGERISNAGGSSAPRPGSSPATPKQLQTIQRMARAAGKTVPTENLSRAQASEIISSLIGEMDQRAS